MDIQLISFIMLNSILYVNLANHGVKVMDFLDFYSVPHKY